MFARRLLQCINSAPRISHSNLDGVYKSTVSGGCTAHLFPSPHQCSPQARHLTTTTALAQFPPNSRRPYIDYHLPKIRAVRARKCAPPLSEAHKFARVPRTWNLREIPEEGVVTQEKHDQLADVVIDKVNSQLEAGRAGRLFAVVEICAKQYVIKSEDIIIVQGYWAPALGDVIRLDKVLLMGGRDFTLLGRPTLPRDQVFVEATVVEKTLSHTIIGLQWVAEKKQKKYDFQRVPKTYLRINKVCVLNKVNDLPEVRGVEGVVFGNT